MGKPIRHTTEQIIQKLREADTLAAEDINNKIQTIKKKTYGFRNIPRVINAIYFHCAGLRVHPLYFRKPQVY